MTQKVIGMRFSLPEKRFETLARIQSENRRNNWLKNRIKIFNNVTFKSLEQHIDDDIKVLMFMSEKDRWVYKNLFCSDINKFIPIYTDRTDINNLFIEETKKRVFPKRKIILMRMDSDDAIHKDFFKGVDERLNLNNYVIQPTGIMWNGSQGAVVRNKGNQFITIYTNKTISPFAFKHASVLQHRHVIVEKDKPMWLTYVHGRNVSNNIGPHAPSLTDIDVSEFGINPADFADRA